MALLAIGSATLVASGVNPYDRLTWFLEVLPIFIGVPILLCTRTRFQFTPLAYRLVFIHCLVLMLGGHYTAAGCAMWSTATAASAGGFTAMSAHTPPSGATIWCSLRRLA